MITKYGPAKFVPIHGTYSFCDYVLGIFQGVLVKPNEIWVSREDTNTATVVTKAQAEKKRGQK
jgi:hypothetical protein